MCLLFFLWFVSKNFLFNLVYKVLVIGCILNFFFMFIRYFFDIFKLVVIYVLIWKCSLFFYKMFICVNLIMIIIVFCIYDLKLMVLICFLLYICFLWIFVIKSFFWRLLRRCFCYYCWKLMFFFLVLFVWLCFFCV